MWPPWRIIRGNVCTVKSNSGNEIKFQFFFFGQLPKSLPSPELADTTTCNCNIFFTWCCFLTGKLQFIKSIWIRLYWMLAAEISNSPEWIGFFLHSSRESKSHCSFWSPLKSNSIQAFVWWGKVNAFSDSHFFACRSNQWSSGIRKPSSLGRVLSKASSYSINLWVLSRSTVNIQWSLDQKPAWYGAPLHVRQIKRETLECGASIEVRQNMSLHVYYFEFKGILLP